MHDPRVERMTALHRILRYVQGSLDHGLQLYKYPISSLLLYTDANWGGCPNTRHSTSGYCVFWVTVWSLGLLSDNLRFLSPVLRSNIMVLLILFLKLIGFITSVLNFIVLFLQLLLFIVTMLVLFICLATLFIINGTKHIEMDIHFIHERVKHGDVRVLHVPSRYQIADIFDDFRSSLKSPLYLTAGV